jgi:uncharacterized Tic20 family protein
MTPYTSEAKQDKKAAAMAQILFLTNITVLPIFSFLLLIYFYQRQHKALVISHFRQSILANIVAGILLLLVSFVILAFGDFASVYTWMWLILYFTCIHSVLILFGVFALIKAQAGQSYYYPLIGKLWRSS